MELDGKEKLAVEELGNAINIAIEQSPTVAEAIDYLRQMGLEPNLRLKLEVGLQEITDFVESEEPLDEEPDLELTADDLRTLQRMKIII